MEIPTFNLISEFQKGSNNEVMDYLIEKKGSKILVIAYGESFDSAYACMIIPNCIDWMDNKSQKEVFITSYIEYDTKQNFIKEHGAKVKCQAFRQDKIRINFIRPTKQSDKNNYSLFSIPIDDCVSVYELHNQS